MNAEVDPDSTVRRLLLSILLVALSLLCLMVLSPFVTPILWAAILAYASWPLFRRLRSALHGWNTTAALLMTLMLTLAVVLPMLWILVLVQGELTYAYQSLSQYLAQGPHPLPPTIRAIPWLGERLQATLDNYAANPTVLAQQLSAWALRWSSNLGKLLGGVGRNVVKLSLSMITLFFFFRDGDTISKQTLAVIRRFFSQRLTPYLITAGKVTRAVVYGMLITACTQGLIAGIGYWVFGLAAPVLLGTLTALLSVVPMVGTAIVWAPLSLWLMSSGHLARGSLLLLWGALLVHPADNVLRPILISNAASVPFLLVMFGVLGGLEAFGFIGIFLGPVLLAVAMAIWREWAAEQQ